LTDDGLAVLELAIAEGVAIDMVNIMTMNFGDAFPQDQMGQNTIQAAESLFAQLQTLYPDQTDEQLWSMIGLTPMIGINDRTTQTFTLEDAKAVVAFAEARGIGRLAMWALNRDEECVSGVEIVALNCSGTLQSEYAYSMIFNTLTEPALGES
jgi:chitinase